MYDYSDEDNDDDILSDSSSNSTPSHSELTEALKHAILSNPGLFNLLDSDPSVALPRPVKNFFFLLKAIASINSYSTTHNANARATAYVLDELTEGRVTKITRVFESERAIQSIWFSLNSINKVLLRLESRVTSDNETGNVFLSYCKVYADIQSFCLAAAIDEYTDLCELAGYTPDQSLISFGSSSFSDFHQLHSSPYPNIESHAIHGDVSSSVQVGTHYLSFIVDSLVEIVLRNDGEVVLVPVSK